MNRMTFLWTGALLALAACADENADGASGGTGHGDRPEYTYTAVEYRKKQNGGF